METKETKSSEAQSKLLKLMRDYDRFGADDSEGNHTVDMVENAADNGKVPPLRGRNPFQLYESVPGWEEVSTILIAAAHEYWLCMLEERLGITVVRESA